jgi:hypothetical protein
MDSYHPKTDHPPTPNDIMAREAERIEELEAEIVDCRRRWAAALAALDRETDGRAV